MIDRLFSSLGDPTRIAIVERLAREREVSVGELAAPFAASLPAVIKHIDILEDAGVVIRRRQGRNVHCTLSADAMTEARAWLDRNLGFWTASFDRLEALIDNKDHDV